MNPRVSVWAALFGREEWRHRFFEAISWNALGSVVNAGCNIGLAMALANIFGQEQFGKWSIVQNTMITAAGIAQLSVGQAASKFVAQYRAQDPVRVSQIIQLCRGTTFVMAIFAGILMLVGGNVIAVHMLGDAKLGDPVRLCSIAVFFTIITGLQTGVLTGLGRFGEQAFVLIGMGCLGFIAVASAAWIGGLNSAVIAFGAVAMLKSIVFEWQIWRITKCNRVPLGSIRASDFRMVASFAIPAALGGMSSMPAQWFAYTCLARQSSGFVDIGLFSAANALGALVLFAPLLANRVSNSFLSYELAQPGAGNFQQLFAMNVKLTAAMCLPVAIGVGVAGPWALAFFGRNFEGAIIVLIALLLAGVFEAIQISYYQAIQSRGLMWLSLWSVALPRDIMIGIGGWLLSPRLGALGLAIAFASGHALALIVTATLAKKLNR